MSKEDDETSVLELSTIFKALGDKTRLRIFEYLRQYHDTASTKDAAEPEAGPTVGAICTYLTGADKITSVVSFHLKELRNAGLIDMIRHGRHIVCVINPIILMRLAEYLNEPVVKEVYDRLTDGNLPL